MDSRVGNSRRDRLSGGLIMTMLLAGVFVVSSPGQASAVVDGCTGADDAPEWSPSDDAYLITNEVELAYIGTNDDCLDDSFLMNDDITITVSPWEPIADFVGTFDGGGNTIDGLVLSGSGAGLFNTEDGARISHLVIDDVTVDGTDGEDDQNVGAVVGLAQGELTLDDVQASGTISAEDGSGGLVGYSLGSVEVSSSSFDGDVTATIDDGIFQGTAGGLVGMASDGVTISSSTYEGNVSARYYAGGLVGYVPNDSASIDHSSATGSVTANLEMDNFTDSYAGGLLGMAVDGATITSSSFDGDVVGWTYAGGLVAYAPNGMLTIGDSNVSGTVSAVMEDPIFKSGYAGGLAGLAAAGAVVTDSSFDGDVDAWTYAGGLIGDVVNEMLTIVDSGATATVTAHLVDDFSGGSAGGLVGSATAGAGVSGASFDGDVEAWSNSGGLIGEVFNDFLTVEDSSVSGSVTATVVDDFITEGSAGGLVGLASMGATVTDSSFDGDVEAWTYAGGLIAYIPNESITVEDSSATGTVTSTLVDESFDAGIAGGLVGLGSFGATITGSSFEGEVEAWSHAGGLVAYVPNGETSIDDSSASGTVTSTMHDESFSEGIAGGLVGLGSEDTSVSESSFDGDVEAWTHAGGLVAYVPNGALTVDRSYAAATVSAVSDDDFADGFAGGIAGFIQDDATFSLTYFSGDATADDTVGGLLGFTNGDVGVVSSFAAGSVTGTSGEGVGGLVGRTSSDVEVSDSFYNGDIAGVEYVGGLIGLSSSGGDIDLARSYHVGEIDDTDAPEEKDLVGSSSGDLTITESFCIAEGCDDGLLIQSSELSSPRYLIGAGWDLHAVWCFSSGHNDGFPVIRAITFGPLESGCARRSGGGRRQVTFDPAGGTCVVGGESIDRPWTVRFRGATLLPLGDACSRPGFALAGWTADPVDAVTPVLISTSSVRAGHVRAVWKPVPGYALAFSAVRDFLCPDCNKVFAVWIQPEGDVPVIGAQLSVDGVAVECSLLVDVWIFHLCGVDDVAPGPHTLGIRLRSEGGLGPAFSIQI